MPLSMRLIALALVCLPAPAFAADPDASDWSPGLKSSVRLIAGRSGEAGVEIRLAPGAITYWRDPGDAGLPPVFDFAGSDNLAQVRPLFPAPTRIAEAGGGEAFGYERGVVLPLDIKPLDAARPVTLALKLNYAVCEKICVPAQASLKLALRGDDGSPYAPAIARARAQAPLPRVWPLPGAELTGQDDKTWRLCLPAQSGGARDIFIEPPERWWFEAKAQSGAVNDRDCFSIVLREKPEGAALPAFVRLTITGGAGPLETTLALEAPKT